MGADALPIRPITALSDLSAVVDLQHTYWGKNPEAITPAHVLFSIVAHGGHVLGAFDGDRLVGAVVGFLGVDTPVHSTQHLNERLHIYSKRMIVLDAYRSSGLGAQLKFAQRAAALALGVRRVTWTFDPLLARNAYLNLHKLGGEVRHYWEDYYGPADAAPDLALGGASDRLYLEWFVDAPHVVARAQGRTMPPTPANNLPLLLSAALSRQELPTPFAVDRPLWGAPLLGVVVPSDVQALARQDEGLARAWRLALRGALGDALTHGYTTTDFARDTGMATTPHGVYVLTRAHD